MSASTIGAQIEILFPLQDNNYQMIPNRKTTKPHIQFRRKYCNMANRSHSRPDQFEGPHRQQHILSQHNIQIHVEQNKQKVTYFVHGYDQKQIVAKHTIDSILRKYSIEELQDKIKEVYDPIKKQYEKPNLSFDVKLDSPVLYQLHTMLNGTDKFIKRRKTELVRFVYSWFEVHESYILLTMFPLPYGEIEEIKGQNPRQIVLEQLWRWGNARKSEL